MPLSFLKPLATLLPPVKRVYAKIKTLQEENQQLRSLLQSVDLYYVSGEAIKLKSNEIEPLFLDSLVANQYEVEELMLAKKLIQPNDTVLDLGCGLGISSIIAARAAKTGRVVAYEADPKMARLAQANISLNASNVTIYNKAIARESGFIDFFIADNFQYNSRFGGESTKKISVESASFQQVIQEISPTLITCDVEGVETDLFENISMPTVRCIIVEVHPAIIGQEGVARCTNALRQIGLMYQPQLSFGVVMVYSR